MKPRHTAILITTVAMAAFYAVSPNSAVAEQRRPPHARIQAKTPARTRHARQMDINDVAGRGAWLGCGARHASAGTRESAALPAIYCGRAPIFLASRAGDAAPGAWGSA